MFGSKFVKTNWKIKVGYEAFISEFKVKSNVQYGGLYYYSTINLEDYFELPLSETLLFRGVCCTCLSVLPVERRWCKDQFCETNYRVDKGTDSMFMLCGNCDRHVPVCEEIIELYDGIKTIDQVDFEFLNKINYYMGLRFGTNKDYSFMEYRHEKLYSKLVEYGVKRRGVDYDIVDGEVYDIIPEAPCLESIANCDDNVKEINKSLSLDEQDRSLYIKAKAILKSMTEDYIVVKKKRNVGIIGSESCRFAKEERHEDLFVMWYPITDKIYSMVGSNLKQCFVVSLDPGCVNSLLGLKLYEFEKDIQYIVDIRIKNIGYASKGMKIYDKNALIYSYYVPVTYAELYNGWRVNKTINRYEKYNDNKVFYSWRNVGDRHNSVDITYKLKYDRGQFDEKGVLVFEVLSGFEIDNVQKMLEVGLLQLDYDIHIIKEIDGMLFEASSPESVQILKEIQESRGLQGMVTYTYLNRYGIYNPSHTWNHKLLHLLGRVYKFIDGWKSDIGLDNVIVYGDVFENVLMLTKDGVSMNDLYTIFRRAYTLKYGALFDNKAELLSWDNKVDRFKFYLGEYLDRYAKLDSFYGYPKDYGEEEMNTINDGDKDKVSLFSDFVVNVIGDWFDLLGVNKFKYRHVESLFLCSICSGGPSEHMVLCCEGGLCLKCFVEYEGCDEYCKNSSFYMGEIDVSIQNSSNMFSAHRGKECVEDRNDDDLYKEVNGGEW